MPAPASAILRRSVASMVLWCSDCGSDASFEPVDDLPGDRSQRVELVCVGCDAAVMLGLLALLPGPHTDHGALFEPAVQLLEDVAPARAHASRLADSA